MTTCQQLIELVLAELHSGHRTALNKLAQPIDENDTTLTFQYQLGAISQGARLAVGLEDMYVWETNPGARTATVQRAMDGSMAAAADADVLVSINPPASPWRVLQAANATLVSLHGAGLYQMKTVELTSSPTEITYDLTVPDIHSVYDVLIDTSDASNAWPRIASWEVRRNQSTAEFPSGFALRLQETVESGRTIRVLYKAPFGTLSALDDDVEATTGISASMVDLVSLGAMLRLSGVRDPSLAFTDAQPDPRRAQEVPVGSGARSIAALLSLYRMRLNEERALLAAKYPERRR